MKLFVDASALVAIIAGEAERPDFVERIDLSQQCFWSAMSCWETVAALCNSHHFTRADARSDVERVTHEMSLQLVSIGERELSLALDAYERYGKGRHPAALNMGDCFAYACAQANGAALLYKGGDFAKKDLA